MPPPPAADVLIVGAGAAGLATAAWLVERRPTMRIVVLDGARTLGAKILVSGGGRCNLTNVTVSERDFNGATPGALRRVLSAFSSDDTVNWFARLGVATHVEAHGKVFPDSQRARDVLDALLGAASGPSVHILPSVRVSSVDASAAEFRVSTTSGEMRARYVVLATGGRALPKSGSDGAGYAMAEALGHRIVPTTPALVPLCLDGESHRSLSGVSQDVILRMSSSDGARTFEGSLLWTHIGVSGPAVLDVSRHWLRAQLRGTEPRLTLACSMLAFQDEERWWITQQAQHPKQQIVSALGGRLPRAVAEMIVGATALDPTTPLAVLTREARRALVHALTAWPLPVIGSRGYSHAEATAGGVDMAQVDASTLASRVCPGLYLVGEVVDVDGRLGGVNFHWAWSSAFQAAKAIAARAGA